LITGGVGADLANSGGYSRPAERLGAHIALLLNASDDDGLVALNAFDLWRRLTRLLSNHTGYRWRLLGLSNSSHCAPEQVATQWIDLVLDAERQAHAGRDHHNGHLLLDHICGRGTGIKPSKLTRGETFNTTNLSALIAAIADRLSAWDEGRSGPPNKNGPAGISLGGQGPIPMPEALSLWGALKSAPSQLEPLDAEAELKLIHFLARAVHSANKHWEMLARLQLHPPDWLDADDEGPLSTLTTNQARLAVKFVQKAQANTKDTILSVENWRDAWNTAPITKSLSFDAFSKSPVGRHLMSSEPATFHQADIDVEQLPEIDDGPVASLQDAQSTLNSLGTRQTIEARDLDLCKAVLAGYSLSEIFESSQDYQNRFASFDDFVDHSDKVAEQIASFVENLTLEEALD